MTLTDLLNNLDYTIIKVDHNIVIAEEYVVKANMLNVTKLAESYEGYRYTICTNINPLVKSTREFSLTAEICFKQSTSNNIFIPDINGNLILFTIIKGYKINLIDLAKDALTDEH